MRQFITEKMQKQTNKRAQFSFPIPLYTLTIAQATKYKKKQKNKNMLNSFLFFLSFRNKARESHHLAIWFQLDFSSSICGN
jgi:hypothetical protein